MSDWSAFAEFMNKVQQAKAGLCLLPHQDAWYRGHTDKTHKLLPSLLRRNCDTAEAYWRLERRTFFQFRTLARELHTPGRQDWDVLFHMQHHGLPTRLLDWTSVFGVALYFALLGCETNPGRTPCIWLMSPYALNKREWDTYNLLNTKYLARDNRRNRSYDFGELLLGEQEGCLLETDDERARYYALPMHQRPQAWEMLSWDKPLAIYDNQRSDRMSAQSGWFTIHGRDHAPLEEIYEDDPKIIKRVDIPANAIAPAKEFLILAGIGHRQLFPGLDGLAKSVHERFLQTSDSNI